jgi:hypothetical protein
MIGSEAGFAHIQDFKSSATGWVDITAVAEVPAEQTSASYASRQYPTASPQQDAAEQPGSGTNFSRPSPAPQGPLGGILGGLFGSH